MHVAGVHQRQSEPLSSVGGDFRLFTVLVVGAQFQGIGQQTAGKHLRAAFPAERMRQYRQMPLIACLCQNLRHIAKPGVFRIGRAQYQQVLHFLRACAQFGTGENPDVRKTLLQLLDFPVAPNSIVLGDKHSLVTGLDQPLHQLSRRGLRAGTVTTRM